MENEMGGTRKKEAGASETVSLLLLRLLGLVLLGLLGVDHGGERAESKDATRLVSHLVNL